MAFKHIYLYVGINLKIKSFNSISSIYYYLIRIDRIADTRTIVPTNSFIDDLRQSEFLHYLKITK